MPTNFNDTENAYTANTTSDIIGSPTLYTAENDTLPNLRKMAASIRRYVNLEHGNGNNAVMSAEYADRLGAEVVARYGFVEFTKINLKTGEKLMRIGYHAVTGGNFPLTVIMAHSVAPGQIVTLDGDTMYISKESDNGKYTKPVIRYTAGPRQKRQRKPYTRKQY